MKIDFEINGKAKSIDADGQMPLLWVLRDELDLKGTKFGCGKAMCGACTVHVDGDAVRSCSFPVEYAIGKKIKTIEAGSENDATIRAVQQAWTQEIVPQCGYCQPGFMMATANLLDKIPNPTNQDIDDNITNICRCGTYSRIRKAIHTAAKIKANASK